MFHPCHACSELPKEWGVHINEFTTSHALGQAPALSCLSRALKAMGDLQPEEGEKDLASNNIYMLEGASSASL